MKNLLILTLFTLLFFSCGSSNITTESLNAGDSLFVDSNLRISVAARVHRTNLSGYVDGHARVDSSKLETVFANLNRQFFFNRENTFVGTFEKVCEFDTDYIVINLHKDIKRAILKDKEHFGKKIQADKKKFYSGEISKGIILENFPSEIYIELSGLNNASADSVFNVLK